MLNVLPDGTPSPKYKVTAMCYFDEEEKTEILQEWWNNGKMVETIQESAEGCFYEVFDKAPFKILEIVKLQET